MTKIANFSLVCAAIVISLGTAEIAIRLWDPGYSPENRFRFYAENEKQPSLGKAGVFRQIGKAREFDVEIRINELGFRDPKILNSASRPGLLALGDSFTMGWGVSLADRYSTLLESKLGIPVYNTAMPGDFVTYLKQLAYAETLGASITGLVVGVTMENDIVPYDKNLTISVTSSMKIPDREQYDLTTVSGWKWLLSRTSAAYLLLVDGVRSWPWVYEKFRGFGLMDQDIGNIVPGYLPPDKLNSAADLAVRFSRKYSVVFVIIPSRKLWVPEEKDSADTTYRQFVTALRIRGLNVVDLRPVFETNGNPLDYFYKYDGHWTPAGHQVAARELLNWIVKSGFPNPSRH